MKIGILGGLTPQATIEYYKLIISQYHNKIDSAVFPEMVIESVDVSKVHHLTMGKKFQQLIQYLSESMNNLMKAGSDVILIASNTPHLFYEDITRNVGVPVISIVDATYNEVMKSKKNRIGLLGTIPTMQSDLYKKPFINTEIQIFVPEITQQDFLQEKIFKQFSRGIFIEEDITAVGNMIHQLKSKYNINGLILGCTELPIFLEQDDWDDITLFNTAAIHVDSLIRFLKKAHI
jgi:aspartate racemase